MKTIWKYPFPNRDSVLQVQLCEPQVLLVAAEPNRMVPTVWIAHDPDLAADKVLSLEFVGTGHPVPEGMDHIGSCVCGPFVWHVYSRVE